jgi:hypothetical protein
VKLGAKTETLALDGVDDLFRKVFSPPPLDAPVNICFSRDREQGCPHAASKGEDRERSGNQSAPVSLSHAGIEPTASTQELSGLKPSLPRNFASFAVGICPRMGTLDGSHSWSVTVARVTVARVPARPD